MGSINIFVDSGFRRNDGSWRRVRQLRDFDIFVSAVRSLVIPAKAGIHGIFVILVTGLGDISIIWVFPPLNNHPTNLTRANNH